MATVLIEINDNTGDLKVLKMGKKDAVKQKGAHKIKEIINVHTITVIETGNPRCIVVGGVRYCW